LILIAALTIAAALTLGPAPALAGGPGTRPPEVRQEAQSRPKRSLSAIVVDDAEIILRDAVGFYTAPASFDRTDLDRVLAGTGAVAVTMAMDEPLNNLMVTYPPPEAMTGPLHWGEEWGRLRTMQFASLGLYAGGLALGGDGVRVTGRLMGEALLLAGIPAITLQYTLGRSRPYAGKGAFNYTWFEWSNENQSLPSGHATVAFAVSTVLAKRIDRWWVSVPLYASAGLTVLAMGWNNQHWPSDLLIGAALGYLAGSFVVGREEARAAEGSSREGAGIRDDRRARFQAGLGARGVYVTYRIY
jgi:membrane-associated phospholipid phosphatase